MNPIAKIYSLLGQITIYKGQGCAGRSFFQRGGAGRGEDKNPRGGAKVKIHGAGRGKRTRKSTDPKIRQQCVYCYGDI